MCTYRYVSINIYTYIHVYMYTYIHVYIYMERCEGDASAAQVLPPWVIDAVAHGRIVPAEPLHCSFTLLPAEGSRLPQLAVRGRRRYAAKLWLYRRVCF